MFIQNHFVFFSESFTLIGSRLFTSRSTHANTKSEIQKELLKKSGYSMVNSTLLLNTYRSFFSFWKCSVYLHTRLAYGPYIHKACYRKGPMKQTLLVGIKNSPFKLSMAAKVAFQGLHSIKKYKWKIHLDSGILQASFRKVSSTSASLISLGPLNVFKDDSQRSLF